MFLGVGYSNMAFTLDLSNFDTSNVTNMGSMFENTCYNCTSFTFDISNFDTSNVRNTNEMFYATGFCSTSLNISITITNPNVKYYSDMFKDVATKAGSKITVNYTSETSALVDQMIATKSSNSNVVKGVQVD
jgi:surface protein